MFGELMKSNCEQFIKKEDTAETGKRQRGEGQATIREVLEQYQLAARQIGSLLSSQLMKSLIQQIAQQTDFPAMEEMEEQTGGKATDLTSYLWNQLPEQKQIDLAESLELFHLFNSIPADIEGLSKALEERKVDIRLLPYVLAELKKQKVLDLEELTRTDNGPRPQKSLLDRVIEQATKAFVSNNVVPIPDHIHLLSAKENRNATRLVITRKLQKIVPGSIDGVCHYNKINKSLVVFTGNVDILTKIIDLSFSARIESGKKSITLKTTEIMKTIGIEPRNFCLEQKNRLSRPEGRLNFVHNLRKDITDMWGFIYGDTNIYSVLNVERVSIDGKYITFSSPFYDKIIGYTESDSKTNKHNVLLTNECYKLPQHTFEAIKGITNLILSRGIKPKKGEQEITTAITYQRFLEDYTPHLWAHLNSQTTANRNATLKRVFGKLLGTGKTKGVLLDPVFCELTKKYQGITISTLIPTWSRLRDIKITITHRGKTNK